MTNDLKNLFSGALADRPPLPSTDEMLAHARTAERRRTAYLAVGGSAAVAVAAVAAVAIAVPNLPGSGGESVGAPPPPPSASASPSGPAPGPAPSAPPGKAGVPMSHGRNLVNGMTAQLDPRFTATSLINYDDAPTTFDPARNDGTDPFLVNAAAVVRITAGGKEGTMTAYVARDKLPDPAGDLCAPDVATRVGFPAETCQVLSASGKQIRVTTATYAGSGRSTSATLFLGDGWMTVTAHLGSVIPADFTDPLPPDGDPRAMAENFPADATRNPPLADLPLTPQQLADTCAAPLMQPRN
jgi:hypothetical protein